MSLPPSPLRLLPTGATFVGWVSHPLKIRAFPRRTDGCWLSAAVGVLFVGSVNDSQAPCKDFAGPLSINAGNNPVLHPRLIFRPLFGAVFLGTAPVVLNLTYGEQRDDEDKVGPGPEIGEVAEHQGD